MGILKLPLSVLLSSLAPITLREIDSISSEKLENSRNNHPATVSSMAKDNRGSKGRIESTEVIGESVQKCVDSEADP